MKRALFIDRDGTLIVEPADEQIDSLEKLEFIPKFSGTCTSLPKIFRTNCDGHQPGWSGNQQFPGKHLLACP
jgi:histidinol phosphatase-like enzyme